MISTPRTKHPFQVAAARTAARSALFYAGTILSLGLCELLAQTVPSNSSEHPDPRPFAPKFQPYVDNHTLSGAVFLVASRDAILDEEIVGYADLDTKKTMSADAEFWIASMTKPLTATALMMLVDEGKVSVDDPVEKYLPEFKGLMVKDPQGGPSVPPVHPILLREILSHTSGMSNLPDRFAGPLSERVAGYAKADLGTQPGSKFLYVNAGINTVGRIVEVVSGMPYEQFLQERLLTPLGMTDTTFWPNDGQLARLASSYKVGPAGKGLVKTISPLTPIPGKPRFYAFPAGGLFSAAPDLLKFCRMLLRGGLSDGKRYLSETAIATMTKAYTTPATGGSYGLAWMISPKGFLHDGAFKTRMAVVPSEGLVEIFLIQWEGPWPAGVKSFPNTFSETAEANFGNGNTTGKASPAK